MLANVAMGARGQTVLDARPKGRFDGTDPEPRQGMSSGHMPHAMSLPFPSLVQQHKSADPRNEGQSYTKLLPQTELWRTVADAVGGMEELEKLRQAGSGGEISVTATCGSGMTAAVIWLALQQLGVQAAIYDEVSLACLAEPSRLPFLTASLPPFPLSICASPTPLARRAGWDGRAVERARLSNPESSLQCTE